MPRRRRPSPIAILIRVLAVALALGACSDDGGGGDQGGGDMISPDLRGQPDGGGDADATGPVSCAGTGSCEDPAEVCDPLTETCLPRCTSESCGAGRACDGSTGLCIEGDACSVALPCEDASRACDACRGLCIDAEGKNPCTQDNNCLFGEYCEPCTGLCEARKGLCEPCVFNRECGDGDARCVDIPEAGGRFCAQACASVNDCPEGYLCGEGLDQCVPASNDCAAPSECLSDGDCRGLDVICDRGRCRDGCDGPGSCPGGQVCEFGRCLDPCPARPCSADATCDAGSGVCEIEGQCRGSLDCAEAETYCDEAANQCVSGCEVDDDCLSAYKVCEAGACVDRGCAFARDCSFGRFCDLDSGDCYEAEGPYCETCDPNDDAACGGGDNECLQLQDDMGNDVGAFCFVACQGDPDNRCPQGYSCTPLQDQDGNPTGEICYRDCTFDPWVD